MMRITIGVVFAAAFTISGGAQDFIVPPGVPAVAFPKPDRPVANIVSPIWHDEKERDDAGEPSQLVRLLGIKSGMTVADIGAGSGYYVVRLSPIVGSKGRIIAEDIAPKYLHSLRKRVRNLGLQNVVIRLGEPHDPKLPTGSVDIAILVHMYQERVFCQLVTQTMERTPSPLSESKLQRPSSHARILASHPCVTDLSC